MARCPIPRQLLRVLRHRDFRLFWIANSASMLGDNIVAVALALFVIDLTGSATDLGIVLAAYSVPLIGLLLVGGVLADRLPRHLVVVVTDLVRFALHALLAVLIVTGEVRIWHLAVIGVLFGAAEAFYRPAAAGLLPQTVPEDEIQEANAVTGDVPQPRRVRRPGARHGARARLQPGRRVRPRRGDVPVQRGAARARAPA